ncbi:hypothetical protein MGYG_01619 [Nannizzia gypsea CBS 118893]|uniref:Uncharacterized protein n=1 Tax=Arthroderma gypseum (strain ATCC MYA-4604 / CBS 118893) TaxID=535722 RepID=E5R1W1_ARTGP|nr:hypothetical protein MGYG_01619 [Nannizzia gypsea CBS 118893]EFQ98595.1 hypothetical protein MGYG_01619 [Nannizzia gypsea CBS 118893]
MDPYFVHRQFPTSYIRTKLDSELQLLADHDENTALPAAVEDQVTNQLTERLQQQQQHPALQTVDSCENTQRWLRPVLSTSAALPFTPSQSSAGRKLSPKPANGSQILTLCTSAGAASLSPSEINRIGEEFVAQLLQTPVSQEEAEFLLSLPVYTPPRSPPGGQGFALFPPAPVDEAEPAAQEVKSVNSQLVSHLTLHTFPFAVYTYAWLLNQSSFPLFLFFQKDTRRPPSTSYVSHSISPKTLTLKPLQFNTATNSWPLPPIESVTRSFWDPIRDAFREQEQVEKMEDIENWLRELPNADELIEPQEGSIEHDGLVYNSLNFSAGQLEAGME